MCQRCGMFVCGECVQIRAEDVFCFDCARILDRPAPRRALVAFGLAAAPPLLIVVLTFAVGRLGALGGFALGVPLCAVAVALLLEERSARRRADAPAKGPFFSLGWGMLALDFAALAVVTFFVVRQVLGR